MKRSHSRSSLKNFFSHSVCLMKLPTYIFFPVNAIIVYLIANTLPPFVYIGNDIDIISIATYKKDQDYLKLKCMPPSNYKRFNVPKIL